MTIREMQPKINLGPIKLWKMPGEVVDASQHPQSFDVVKSLSPVNAGIAVQVDDSNQASIWSFEDHYADRLKVLKGAEINKDRLARKVIRWTEK